MTSTLFLAVALILLPDGRTVGDAMTSPFPTREACERKRAEIDEKSQAIAQALAREGKPFPAILASRCVPIGSSS